MQAQPNGSRFAVTTVVLIVAWYILSGKLDVLHFGTGLLAAIVIAALFRPWGEPTPVHPLRFLLYLPWLIAQIVGSNLRVARLVLRPSMPITPTFISQEPGVEGERALTTLGSSITLTPGTLTIDVRKEEIFVHALDRRSAEDTRDGVIARHVRPLFGTPRA